MTSRVCVLSQGDNRFLRGGEGAGRRRGGAVCLCVTLYVCVTSQGDHRVLRGGEGAGRRRGGAAAVPRTDRGQSDHVHRPVPGRRGARAHARGHVQRRQRKWPTQEVLPTRFNIVVF